MENNPNKDLSSLLEDIKLELANYVTLRLKWFKLSYQERFAKLLSTFIFGLLITLAVSTILFFTLIGSALLVGRLVGDTIAGFGILSAFMIFVLLVMLLFRKSIESYILNKSIIYLRKLDSDDEDEKDGK